MIEATLTEYNLNIWRDNATELNGNSGESNTASEEHNVSLYIFSEQIELVHAGIFQM